MAIPHFASIRDLDSYVKRGFRADDGAQSAARTSIPAGISRKQLEKRATHAAVKRELQLTEAVRSGINKARQVKLASQDGDFSSSKKQSAAGLSPRMLRIKQVREQEKLRAANVARRRRELQDRKRSHLLSQGEADWEHQRSAQKEELRARYQESLQNVGSAHKRAVASSDRLRHEAHQQALAWQDVNLGHMHLHIDALQEEQNAETEYRRSQRQASRRHKVQHSTSRSQRTRARRMADASRRAGTITREITAERNAIDYAVQGLDRRVDAYVTDHGGGATDYSITRLHHRVVRHNSPRTGLAGQKAVAALKPASFSSAAAAAAAGSKSITRRRIPFVKRERNAFSSASQERARQVLVWEKNAEQLRQQGERARRRSRAAAGRIQMEKEYKNITQQLADMERAKRAQRARRIAAGVRAGSVAHPGTAGATQNANNSSLLEEQFERMFVDQDLNTSIDLSGEVLIDDSGAAMLDDSALLTYHVHDMKAERQRQEEQQELARQRQRLHRYRAKTRTAKAPSGADCSSGKDSVSHGPAVAKVPTLTIPVVVPEDPGADDVVEEEDLVEPAVKAAPSESMGTTVDMGTGVIHIDRNSLSRVQISRHGSVRIELGAAEVAAGGADVGQQTADIAADAAAHEVASETLPSQSLDGIKLLEISRALSKMAEDLQTGGTMDTPSKSSEVGAPREADHLWYEVGSSRRDPSAVAAAAATIHHETGGAQDADEPMPATAPPPQTANLSPADEEPAAEDEVSASDAPASESVAQPTTSQSVSASRHIASADARAAVSSAQPASASLDVAASSNDVQQLERTLGLQPGDLTSFSGLDDSLENSGVKSPSPTTESAAAAATLEAVKPETAPTTDGDDAVPVPPAVPNAPLPAPGPPAGLSGTSAIPAPVAAKIDVPLPAADSSSERLRQLAERSRDRARKIASRRIQRRRLAAEVASPYSTNFRPASRAKRKGQTRRKATARSSETKQISSGGTKSRRQTKSKQKSKPKSALQKRIEARERRKKMKEQDRARREQLGLVGAN